MVVGPSAAFNGTGSDHGGTVISTGFVFVNGNPIAHVGDLVDCDDEPIIAGSTTVFAEGRSVARLGDPVECDAVLTPPVSLNVFVGVAGG